jgi:hypothetical protein
VAVATSMPPTSTVMLDNAMDSFTRFLPNLAGGWSANANMYTH